MAAECGLPQDHPKHFPIVDGVVILCDGDASARPNYDGSAINKPS